jgi:hypothetical protein
MVGRRGPTLYSACILSRCGRAGFNPFARATDVSRRPSRHAVFGRATEPDCDQS